MIGEALSSKQEFNIGNGDMAIKRTVDKMAEIISLSSKNPMVREWARTVLANVIVNQKYQEAEAIHNFKHRQLC